jgi:hypothetical protein
MAGKKVEVVAGEAVASTALAVADSDKLWKEKVTYFRQSDVANIELIIVANWTKGEFLRELSEDPAKYNNHTAEDLADQLDTTLNYLRACRRFRDMYTLEEAKSFARDGLPWQAIYYLLWVDSKERRAKLLLRYKERIAKAKTTNERQGARTVAFNELRDAARDLNKTVKAAKQEAGEKVSKRGGTPVAVLLRSTTALCADMIKRIDACDEAREQWAKMEDGENKTKLAEEFEGANQSLASLFDRLGDYINEKTE